MERFASFGTVQGTAAEVRRVMYAGASRAGQLLMFVVHGDHLGRYVAQLAADGLAVRIWTPEASSKITGNVFAHALKC